MPKREIAPEREKKRQTFQAENSPESNNPPVEDAPEQDITPEFEGDPLQTEGETTEKLRFQIKKRNKSIRRTKKKR